MNSWGFFLKGEFVTHDDNDNVYVDLFYYDMIMIVVRVGIHALYLCALYKLDSGSELQTILHLSSLFNNA